MANPDDDMAPIGGMWHLLAWWLVSSLLGKYNYSFLTSDRVIAFGIVRLDIYVQQTNSTFDAIFMHHSH